jgi:hypothetical protein
MTKREILDHMLTEHDPDRIFAPPACRALVTTRMTLAALQRAHQQEHAGLESSHVHDSKTGRSVPAGDCLPFTTTTPTPKETP